MVAETETHALAILNGPDELQRFTDWLRRNGRYITPNRSGRQVVRYIGLLGQIGLVYLHGGKGHCNAVAAKHLMLFRAGRPLTRRRVNTSEGKRQRIARIRERDGDDCCICGRWVLPVDETVEHWVARSCDGTEDDANIGLAHRLCNELLGDLSVCEKIRLRDEIRELVALDAFDPIQFRAERILARRGIYDQVQRDRMPGEGDAPSEGARDA